MDFGNILIHIAYALNVIALAFREILWIRVILTLSYLLRFITQYIFENNLNTSFWMVVFIIINLVQIIQIINERRNRFIDPKINDIYKTVFGNLTSYEFLNFWKTGTIKKIDKGNCIITKGEKLKSVLLLLSGNVIIKNKEKVLSKLFRGSFMGEMSFISNQETSADVISSDNVIYIEWSKEDLNKIKKTNNMVWTKIQNVFLNDLIDKVKRSNK